MHPVRQAIRGIDADKPSPTDSSTSAIALHTTHPDIKLAGALPTAYAGLSYQTSTQGRD